MTLPEPPPGEETAGEALDVVLEADPPLPVPAGVKPKRPAAAREPLHFIVIALLIADIVFGLGLAIFAEKVLMFRPMAIMGCGLAALGLGVLAYFVLLGSGRGGRW